MHKLLLPEGTKVLMLGNEAIARGALESGVGFASAYPGTPSSEIVESLLEVAKEVGMYVEWSVNEKVAYEAAYAAALSGVRSLVAMKHVGLNVASDPLMTSAYIGVEAGFVVVTADDPNMHSSQNEQDNRWYGLHAYIPVFEPSTPQEAKDLTVFLYGFSEKHKHPVILRSVTRISHTHSVVTLGKMVKPKTKGFFVKNPRERVAVPQYAREMKRKLLAKWRNICDDMVKNPFNRVINSGMENIIIASGIGFSYVYELLKTHNLLDKFTIIKLSSAVPIPRETILRELDNAEKVLIVEEGDPVVEYQVKAIVAEEKMGLEIYGKNVIEPMGELSLSKIAEGVKKAFNIEVRTSSQEVQKDVLKEIPSRPPTLCPGCPYRSLYYALKLTLAKLKVKAVFSGDIGCYTLGVNKPFEMHDTVVDMGASIGLANGFSHVLDEKTLTIAFIGDSTFYHAGIPPLLNAVVNNAPFLTVVFDNETTAMTGFQPHPGSDKPTSSLNVNVRVPIENIAKALGITETCVVDPYNIGETRATLERLIKYVINERKPAVLIARRPCVLYKPPSKRGIVVIEKAECIKCRLCYDFFSCPAIVNRGDGVAEIVRSLCIDCGACVEVCPTRAIKVVRK